MRKRWLKEPYGAKAPRPVLRGGGSIPTYRNFPLLGSLCAGFLGRLLGFRGAVLLTTGFVFFAFILSCGAFYEVALCASPCYIKLAPWFATEMFDACWGFLFDSLTVVMCVVVTLVSSLGAGCTPQLQSHLLSTGSILIRASRKARG